MADESPVSFKDIFILSKGRFAQTRTTWEVLMDDHIPFSLVVEPQELSLYEDRLAECAKARAKKLPKGGGVKLPPYRCVVLPKQNQGVSFARNCVLESYAPAAGWFWIMDDDIYRFYQAEGGKTVPISAAMMLAEVASRMSVCVHRKDIALFALEYQQFSFSYDSDAVSFNSYCNIAVCMTKERMPDGLRYRFRVREDYDFVLQLVKAGYSTVRFRNLSFSVPGMGQKEGGMKAYYEKQKKDIKIQNSLFLEAWGMVAEEVRKGTGPTERDDIRVKWALLNDPDEAYTLLNSRKFKGFSKDPLATRLAGAGAGKDDGGATGVSTLKGLAARTETAAPPTKKRSTVSPPPLPPPPTRSKGKSARVEEAAAEEPSALEQPRRPQPKPPAPRPAKGGWCYEKYRVVVPDELRKTGLEHLPAPKLGDAVCYVPFDPKQPPLLTGTVIAVEAANRVARSVTVIPDRRGDAMFCCETVFAVPANFAAVEAAVIAHYTEPEDSA